ncbi:TadE/TadG family type IV pilus assembly protein [Paenibacillus sp. P36]|uniref:TadE/TadG family type IV pilus assembly protein n=1 Tax=Paenibacillus sp. P36 TaxID=3342538 RepID=UPI0038B40C89
MKRFVRSERGAVSVYLILIIVPVFLFQAVLIDFARIKLAEKETESAVKAAARSVMSSFDTKLQAMGLYGLGISQELSEEVFRTVFANNLSSQVSTGAFHYVDTKPIDHGERVTPVYALASHEIFERQLLEDMKIKAPIEFMLEITDKFRKTGTKAPFQFGSQFSKEAAELEKLIDQREKQLDEAWQSSEELYRKTSLIHSNYQTRITELDSLASQIGIHTADEVRNEIVQVENQLQSVQASIRDLDMSIAAISRAGSGGLAGMQAILESRHALSTQAQQLSQKLNDLQNLLQLIIKYVALLAATKLEALANTKEIGLLQQAIEPALRTAKQQNDEIRTKLNGITSRPNTEGTSANEVFQSVSVLGDEYFYKYQTAVASITALFTAFQEVVDSVQLYTAENTNKANQANDAHWTESQEFYNKQSVLERTRMEQNSAVSANKQQQKSKIQTILNQAKQSIGGCSLVNAQSSDDELYDRLQGTGSQSSSSTKGFYQKYREANAQEATIGSEVAYDLEKSEPVSLKAMDMLAAFNNAAEVMRNELYVNEYALTKFNYRTIGLEKDQTGSPKVLSNRADPRKHSLANQEVEYLLYGFSSCSANISSAYAEMFSFRLAIRTVEALLDPKKELLNIGSPLLVLLAAAAEGAVLAFQDMTKLVNGEAVELSAKIAAPALSLTYKDYLRVFMLIHSNNTKQMARMQALIELETGRDLMQATTYLQGNASSDIKLWFISQIMKLLDGSGLLGCKVIGNRCQFSSSAAVAY